MKNLKNIFALSLLVSILTGCWEKSADSNVVAIEQADPVVTPEPEPEPEPTIVLNGDIANWPDTQTMATDPDDIDQDYNDIVKNGIFDDEDNLYFYFENVADIAADHMHDLYIDTGVAHSSSLAVPGAAPSLTAANADIAYRFTLQSDGNWTIAKYTLEACGDWVQSTSDAEVTLTTQNNAFAGAIPLYELNGLVKDDIVKVKFVSSGAGWGTDESPNSGHISHTMLTGAPANIAPADLGECIVEEEAAEQAIAQIVETDDIGMPGNDIETVSIAIDGTNLVISQTHKAAKDAWHNIRIYLNTDDSDTIDTPMLGGAAALTGLVAEYGYGFQYTGADWNTTKQEVTSGAWADAISTATAIGGDTELTTITIPLSEIGNPVSSSTIKMMFVGTGDGWGTDQAPNDAMYDFIDSTLPSEPNIVETDDIGMPGNDIESVSIVIDDTNIVISQIHKAAKDAWHNIRVYLNTDDSDIIDTPMLGGAASLTGLVAEYGYGFQYTGADWNTAKQEVTNGVWVDAVSTATATGGDTELTTITIPLSEVGNPIDTSAIKMMFVGTGDGWGTDQAPNDAMYSFADSNSPAVPDIIETDDIGMPGNDIETVSIVNDGSNLVISQTHKAAKDAWHSIRVYLNTDSSDTINSPMLSGAVTLTGLVAEYGYGFQYTGAGWNTAKQEVLSGDWTDATSIATATGGDTELTTITIPLSEVGNPAVGSTIQLMFVGTGDGWGTDQAPNDVMLEYVIKTP